MYKATRSLIKERQKFSKYVVEMVNVKKVSGGKANQCFQNANSSIDRTNGVAVVSGWLVDRYSSIYDETEIIQHWWNADKKGNHFDTTPNIGDEFEYVIDIAIAEFGMLNYDRISSCVSSSLLLRRNVFYAANVEGKYVTLRNIDNVSNDALFANQLQKAAA